MQIEEKLKKIEKELQTLKMLVIAGTEMPVEKTSFPTGYVQDYCLRRRVGEVYRNCKEISVFGEKR